MSSTWEALAEGLVRRSPTPPSTSRWSVSTTNFFLLSLKAKLLSPALNPPLRTLWRADGVTSVCKDGEECKCNIPCDGANAAALCGASENDSNEMQVSTIYCNLFKQWPILASWAVRCTTTYLLNLAIALNLNKNLNNSFSSFANSPYSHPPTLRIAILRADFPSCFLTISFNLFASSSYEEQWSTLSSLPLSMAFFITESGTTFVKSNVDKKLLSIFELTLVSKVFIFSYLHAILEEPLPSVWWAALSSSSSSLSFSLFSNGFDNHIQFLTSIPTPITLWLDTKPWLI